MKTIHFPAFVLLAALLFTSCKNSPESDEAVTTEAKEVPAAAGQTFTINPSESTIEWIGTKVSGYHEGNVPIKSGRLTVKDDGIASGTFVLDLANITVTGPKESKGNDKLLGHLKSDDFFDVAKFPEGTFEITAVKPFTEPISEADDPRRGPLHRQVTGY